jgi:hypothetical protein
MAMIGRKLHGPLLKKVSSQNCPAEIVGRLASQEETINESMSPLGNQFRQCCLKDLRQTIKRIEPSDIFSRIHPDQETAEN